MRAPLTSLVLVLLSAMAGPPATAARPRPTDVWMSPERLRHDFALAVRIDEADVVDVVGYELAARKEMPAFLVGRYRMPSGGDATYSAIAIYYRCQGRMLCLVTASISRTSRPLTVLGLVDLDAPRTEVPLSAAPWPREPAPVGTWPALVVLVEHEGTDPSVTGLALVSLRAEDRGGVVLETPLELRHRDITEEEHLIPGGRPTSIPIGYRLDALVLEHSGGVHRALVSTSAIRSRWSLCTCDEPGTSTLVLTGHRFEAVQPPPL